MPAPARARTEQVEAVTAAPDHQVEDQPVERDHRPIYGLAAGGSLMVVGVLLWGEASSTQDEIYNLPTPKSAKDFHNLTDLESRGDTYALLGNVSFLGGMTVAAISGYFYWRERTQRNGQHARVMPAVFDHGAGIALRFGGSP
jgi:hypothetical protein